MTSSSDSFPFGIADVVELLGLTVRRRLPSSLYLNCPFCGDQRGRLNVNTDKNVWRCNRCGAAGGMLALYARYNGTGNADENLAEKTNLTSKKLQIVCPKQTDDLITEGQALHHCVGTYIDRVAAKKCLIVFVRRVEEPEKPFVTVEVSNGKIVQIRGERNSDPTEEVKKFVDLWSRKVLPMALQAA